MDKQELYILCDRVAGLILMAKKVVVFTGAGVSTESGIPDFRGPGGIWEKFDPDDFTYHKFLRDADVRKKHWRLLRSLAPAAEPNPAHHAIVELNRLGKLDCVITQNVDNLHQRAGLAAEKVLELHGNMQSAVCLGCGRRYPFAQIKVRLDEGEEAPDCEACRGLLKPAVILFGEPLPDEVLREAALRSTKADLFIVIGSTLTVYPAAYMPAYAADAGARLVIINLSDTPLDGQAEIIIRARAGEAMPQIVRRLKEKQGI